MIKPIKYMRIHETFDEVSLNEKFDTLISGGWKIIYYNELKIFENKLQVTMICEKSQENIL